MKGLHLRRSDWEENPLFRFFSRNIYAACVDPFGGPRSVVADAADATERVHPIRLRLRRLRHLDGTA
jgi:hypothetical protein